MKTPKQAQEPRAKSPEQAQNQPPRTQRRPPIRKAIRKPPENMALR